MLFCFLPLLVILTLPHLGHVPSGLLEGPAFAFLLLNCVIVTIIANCKLEGEKRGHEEESQGETMGQIRDEKGDEEGDLVAESVIVEKSQYIDDKPIKTNGHEYQYKNKGGNFVRNSRSLNARSENKTKHEQVKLDYMNEKKPISRARLASRRHEKAIGLHATKPLSADLKQTQLIRGSLTSFYGSDGSHHEKPNNFDNTAGEKFMKGLERSENFIDRPPRQAAEAAAATATAQPSLDEVWAAIMSSNKSNVRMACIPAEERSEGSSSENVSPPQPAAAGTPNQPVVTSAAPAPPAAATTAASPLSAAKAAPNSTGKPSKAEDGDDQGNDGELEELNRRAEEFIARFNRQMRLEREESLQRQKRGRRPCNYMDHLQYPRPLQVPARGLLVG